jgi:hypothetical protein
VKEPLNTQRSASRKPKKAPPPGTIGVIQQKIFGIPVDRQVLFSNHKKAYRKSIEKRQRNLIMKVTFLKSFMRGAEKVLCITTCYSPVTLLEKIGIGWLFIYLKRSLLVFTDQRILHVPTTPSYKYRLCVAEIAYADCSSIRIKGRSLVITYKKHGIIEKFFSLAGKEKKKVSQVLDTLSMAGGVSETGFRTHLCPRCAGVLPTPGRPCANCGLKFKSGFLAALLALVFPGGGYFYVRQYSLGVIAGLVELYLAGVVAVTLQDMAGGIQSGALWMALSAVGLIVEKMVAAAHAVILTKECIPRKKQIEFQPVRAA